MEQNILACFYDCDGTLIPGYMQEPLFRHYQIEPKKFWQEAIEMRENAQKSGINLDQANAYLNLILDYVKRGLFSELSNTKLREFGTKIPVFPGLPEFFTRTKKLIGETPQYAAHHLTLEHYIISTGLKEMILGSSLNKGLTEVFASEFLEQDNQVKRIARVVSFMEKTRFLHEVNKGVNINSTLDVNKPLPRELRRVPFQNMIYIGDGFTDVPCFALINDRAGKSLAVYDPFSKEAFQQAYQLRKEERVFSFSPADYSEGSLTSQIIEHTIKEIADRIIQEREEELRKAKD